VSIKIDSKPLTKARGEHIMLDYKSILNRPIYSIKEGKKCGRLYDMVVDFSVHRVLGIVSGREGDLPKRLIPIAGVANFGIDAVMIQSADQVESADSDQPLANSIKKRVKWVDLKVIKDSGAQVGELSNFVFNEKSGEISSYEISGGIFHKLIEGSVDLPQKGVVSVGPDCMVIKSGTEIVVKEAKGPRKMLISAIDEIKEDIEKVTSAAVGKIKGVKDKIISGREKEKPSEESKSPEDDK
jgi:uncharacterized protein YrrD